MVRISKQGKRRNVSPKRPSKTGTKTGPKKDNLTDGYRVHSNAAKISSGQQVFISKI